MKKVYVALTGILFFAGAATAQTRFGIEGGINLNNLADQYEGETVSNQIKVGFHVGVLADIGISDQFSVAPALRYSMKGGQEQRHYNSSVNGLSAAIEEKNKLSYHYIELPVNLVYKTGMPNEGRFMIGAGPYIAYMVNAQNKQKRTTETIVGGEEQIVVDGDNYALEIGDDPGDQIKGLDYGVQAFVGYQFPRDLFMKVGSQVGFVNTIPGGSSTFKQKNYNFFFTVGYMFGGR